MKPSQISNHSQVAPISRGITTIKVEMFKDNSERTPSASLSYQEKCESVQMDIGDMDISNIQDAISEERRGPEGSEANIIPEETNTQNLVSCGSWFFRGKVGED